MWDCAQLGPPVASGKAERSKEVGSALVAGDAPGEEARPGAAGARLRLRQAIDGLQNFRVVPPIGLIGWLFVESPDVHLRAKLFPHPVLVLRGEFVVGERNLLRLQVLPEAGHHGFVGLPAGGEFRLGRPEVDRRETIEGVGRIQNRPTRR